jgi:hypothetical protein
MDKYFLAGVFGILISLNVNSQVYVSPNGDDTLGVGSIQNPYEKNCQKIKNTPKGVLILKSCKEFLFRNSFLTSWWCSGVYKEPLDFTIFDFTINHL